MSAPAIISSGTASGGPPVGGSGTSSPSTIPRWTGATTLGDSGLIDNGTAIYTTTRNVGIGAASPAGKLDVADAASASVYISRPGLSAVYGAAGLGNLRWRDTANAFDAAQISTVGYFPGSNGQMTFSTASGGTMIERMRIATNASQAASQVAIGTSSFTTGRALTTVADLDVFGVRVGRGSGDDAESTAVGNNALPSQQSGQRYNTAIGRSALGSLTTGESNSALGHSSFFNLSTGNQNVAAGRGAGRYFGAGSSGLTAATNSVFIGFEARANADSESNQIVIGASAVGNGSNTVTIGNSSNVGTFLDTKYVRLVDSYTVGALPVAGTAGRIARVTDGDAALAWGATVVNTGAGATPYLVWDNGTNWTVFGK